MAEDLELGRGQADPAVAALDPPAVEVDEQVAVADDAPARGIGQVAICPPKEFDLLWELLDHKGLVLTRDQLLERVWGYTFAGDTRTVDVHVRQLRRKLGDASPIVTVWGVGYKVGPDRSATPAA